MTRESAAATAVERVFRERSREVLAILLRRFGAGALDRVEDGLQGAFAKAIAVWPQQGVPDNPTAWLATVARNQVLDELRRAATAVEKAGEAERRWYDRETASTPELAPLEDDDLQLILLCCDPILQRHECVALTLRFACGLGTREIARALLRREEAVRKTITRTRERLRRERPDFVVPAAAPLGERLDRVVEILYLLFNEGYAAHSGENLVRRELCAEAMRLAELLLATPLPDEGLVCAVASLMSFQAARLPARTREGRLVRLAEQDRALWDGRLIRRGLFLLERSTLSSRRSKYHLEAAIAACHATAPSWEATDWPRILALYDDLLALAPSPIVSLNRAVAVSMAVGPESGLAALQELEAAPELEGNHLLHSLLADALRRLGREAEAAAHYRRALDLVVTAPERQFLTDQLNSCFAGFDPPGEGD